MDQPVHDFRPVWERASRIHGWLTREEARCLHKHSRAPWCEIGSFLGRSTVVLAQSGHGWAVDTWQGTRAHDAEVGYYAEHDVYQDFARNTAGLPVTAIRKNFRDAAEDVGPISFLYLDADHGYDETREAFERYTPKLGRGDLVAFHDYDEPGWPEVTAFVGSLKWRRVAKAGRVVILRKP